MTRPLLRALPLLLLPIPFLATAQAVAPAAAMTLEQAMADPDWIGPPVERAWWSWDSREAQLQLKREGSAIRDTWRQPVAGGALQRVGDAERGGLDAANPVYDPARRRMTFVRNGDVFLRDLSSGVLVQLTRSAGAESQPRFASRSMIRTYSARESSVKMPRQSSSKMIRWMAARSSASGICQAIPHRSNAPG